MKRELKIKDPRAFGAFLRDEKLFLRRTRAEVRRELPEITKIIHPVDSDVSAIDGIRDGATELAKIILSKTEVYKGQHLEASQQLSNMLRQATGVAKAPYVAEFVRLLIESGQRVLLGGWHRTVWDIWAQKLSDFRVGWYTGSESPTQKHDARNQFIAGELDVLFISLRSGAGLDGLQKTDCKTLVVGELDWAPAVMEQLIGRLHRDGQNDKLMAYFLVSEVGSDPLMAEMLGLKREQLDGIRQCNNGLVEVFDGGAAVVKRLAEDYLRRHERGRDSKLLDNPTA